jgi:hypothetical protein
MPHFLWFLSILPAHPIVLQNTGRTLNKTEIVTALKKAGFPSHAIPTMTCLIQKESNGAPKTVRYNDNGTIDRGLLQINDRAWLKACNTTGKQLLIVENNLKCGLQVYNKQGLTAWYAYSKCGG